MEIAQRTAALLAYLRDYQAILLRQTIAGIAAGIGGLIALVLAFLVPPTSCPGREEKALMKVETHFMTTNIQSFIKRLLILIALCMLCVVPIAAQDNNYTKAQGLISKARQSNAVTLDLSRLGLTVLPPEIGELTRLQTLDLWTNELTVLPPEIGQLANLRNLRLHFNKLTALPPEIGQLTNLEHLTLDDSPLKTLPPEIGQLTNLIGLNLGNTQLTRLPPEIGRLTRLENLILRDNPLTAIPQEVWQLSNLEFLNIADTQLPWTALPPQIGQLTKLESLYFDNLPIKTLPVELGQLTHLIDLRFYGTPLTFPPPGVQQQGEAAMLAYLRDYQAILVRQTIAGIAAGIGGLVALVLAFRWRQRRGLGEKKKRL